MSMAPSEWIRFQNLERLVGELQTSIASLEARASGEAASRQPEPLHQRNAVQKADAARLDEAIGRLLDGHPCAHELSARQIREALKVAGHTPLPGERAIRMHLAAIRGNGNSVRVAG